MTPEFPLILPPPLSPQSIIGIMSPSGPVLDTHLEEGLALLKSWHFEPVLSPQTLARHTSRGYLAGTDTTRLDALQSALDDPDLDAILFARGGYGAMRIVEHLDPTGLRRHPKHIIGFSDITTILLWCYNQANVSCLHAPVLKSLAKTQGTESPPHDVARRESAELLRLTLLGELPHIIEQGLELSIPSRYAHMDVISGPVIAGNLSLIQALLHTPLLESLKDTILILEDVTEPDYRLDRLMTSLRLKVKDQRPAAILLGEFSECGGVYVEQEHIARFVHELASEFDVPVGSGYPIGHGARNHPVPLGHTGSLDLRHGTLEISPPKSLPGESHR